MYLKGSDLRYNSQTLILSEIKTITFQKFTKLQINRY